MRRLRVEWCCPQYTRVCEKKKRARVILQMYMLAELLLFLKRGTYNCARKTCSLYLIKILNRTPYYATNWSFRLGFVFGSDRWTAMQLSLRDIRSFPAVVLLVAYSLKVSQRFGIAMSIDTQRCGTRDFLAFCWLYEHIECIILVSIDSCE